jgi:molybdopterin-guanine dinucleotide biosynthesis protein A
MLEHNISGIILSGGKSSRMGTDKGLLQFKNRPLIEYSLQLLKPCCNEILISTNKKKYEYLGLPLIKDELKDIGPIGGIYSCIKKINNDKALITACDIPEIMPEILQSLVELSKNADVVYLSLPSGKIQSLPLLISKKIESVIDSQIKKKEFALHKLISACKRTDEISLKEIIIERELPNINSIKDISDDLS